MTQAVAALVILVVWSAAVTRQARTDWMPPQMEEIVVQQLVERLGEIDLGWSRERMNNAARVTVATIRARLEQWKETELLARAPVLGVLKLAPESDPRLNAMRRYHMCTAAAMIRHERRAREKSEEARIAAVAALTTGSMAVLYLRDAFINAGGTGANVEKLLTDPALQPIIDRLQTSPDDMMAVQAECVPVLGAITG
jgi:hypothetical protein